jgi:hypothetical protein
MSFFKRASVKLDDEAPRSRGASKGKDAAEKIKEAKVKIEAVTNLQKHERKCRSSWMV